MKLEILKLIVWPVKTSKLPRIVEFSPGKVNVIPGDSRSGKSAIIRIIDYCLGSRECNIPKIGPIRSSSSWFGVLFNTVEGVKLLARRNPGQQDSTDDYFILESSGRIEIPNILVKNSNREDARGILDRLGKIPQVDINTQGGGKKVRGRATISDMTAFIFQPQSLIANQDNMFYESNQEDHARRIREILPLVIGAIDSEALLKQYQLQEIRRSVERAKRKLDVYKESLKDISGQLRGRFIQAIQLGLIGSSGNKEESLEEIDQTILLNELEKVATDPETYSRQLVNNHTIPIERLSHLRIQENNLNAELAEHRIKLAQIKELKKLRESSQGNLLKQQDRLESVKWLNGLIKDEYKCLVCGSQTNSAYDELIKLRKTAIEVEGLLENIRKVPVMLDAEENHTQSAIFSNELILKQNLEEQRQILQHVDRQNGILENRAVFVGGLREFLSILKASSDDGESLIAEILELETEEEKLLNEVDPAIISSKKEAALFKFSLIVQHYAKIMEIETRGGVIHLDTQKLTVSVVNEKGKRMAYLKEIGSGANWLGFHVATLLGLHELFIKEEIPYVPNFLVVDQPSQTHFPDDEDIETENAELQAVRRAFRCFDAAIDRTQGGVQIIVSEHAGDKVISGLQNTVVVENWRKGRKLIPWYWNEEILQELHQTNAEYAFDDLIPLFQQDLVMKTFGDVNYTEYDVDTVSAIFGRDGLYFEAFIYVTSREESKVVNGIVDLELILTITKIE